MLFHKANLNFMCGWYCGMTCILTVDCGKLKKYSKQINIFKKYLPIVSLDMFSFPAH